MLDRKALAAAGVVVAIVVFAVVYLLTSASSDSTVTTPARAAITSTPTGGSAAKSPTLTSPTRPVGSNQRPATPRLSGSTSGSLSIGVTTTPRPTQPAVPLAAIATPLNDLTARLARIEKVQGISNLPGEIAGPSLRITVEYRNATSSPIDLRGAVVNVYAGREVIPSIMLTQPGVKPFPAFVGAGKKAQGTFVFNVPTSLRSQVRVEVDLASNVSILLFEGPVS